MADLPHRTVTPLFADIKRNTRLLQQMGERYAVTMEAQQTLRRSTFDAWDGTGANDVDGRGREWAA